ncbi:MAG: hypothetical protein CFE24_13135 [Flavobacterium sp. BFFFF2]|nr:MAG: hypothetical protein CFE24_13135 [Flavobacterium sp. BFFFF2]
MLLTGGLMLVNFRELKIGLVSFFPFFFFLLSSFFFPLKKKPPQFPEVVFNLKDVIEMDLCQRIKP